MPRLMTAGGGGECPGPGQHVAVAWRSGRNGGEQGKPATAKGATPAGGESGGRRTVQVRVRTPEPFHRSLSAFGTKLPIGYAEGPMNNGSYGYRAGS